MTVGPLSQVKVKEVARLLLVLWIWIESLRRVAPGYQLIMTGMVWTFGTSLSSDLTPRQMGMVEEDIN